MTQNELFGIALSQSAHEMGCKPEDFLQDKNVLSSLVIDEKTRCYYAKPVCATLISYGHNIVAAVNNENREIIRKYLDTYTYYHCFETPNLHALDDALAPLGQRSCFMAEYWLPDLKRLKPSECPLPTRILQKEDFAPLYLPQWSNALSVRRPQYDTLGIGAYDGDKLVGFAACSADCEKMWQIGIDVLPEYRRQGIASALTSTLACEILKRGKVPFYCCAWSNVASARNAVRSGFSPAWAELTIKQISYIDEINKGE